MTARVTQETGGSDTELAARCWDLQAIAAVLDRPAGGTSALLQSPTASV